MNMMPSVATPWYAEAGVNETAVPFALQVTYRGVLGDYLSSSQACGLLPDVAEQHPKTVMVQLAVGRRVEQHM